VNFPGVQRFNQWITHLLKPPHHLLILRLTAIILILHGLDEFQVFRVPERLLAAAVLFIPRLTAQRWAWAVLSAMLVFNNIHAWYLLVNHEFLITYWTLACTLALFTAQPNEVMAKNGRWLIAWCFCLATFWKFLAGEYLDGSFLHLTFLLDQRLELGAFLMGGLDRETLVNNQAVFALLQTLDVGQPLSLETTPLMSGMSVVLSYWTILIEGAVAIAFLLPYPKWMHQHRDWPLLIFIFTTYVVLPVFSFAAVLLVMGLIQAFVRFGSSNLRVARIYLTAFILLPLWLVLPKLILYYLWAFISGGG